MAADHLYYRPLKPSDFHVTKAAHAALFPIDYDDGFFHKATAGLDRIWSCAAFAVSAFSGEERLIGFITAKAVLLHEVDASDRSHMGLLSPVLDHDSVLYILTLGVLDGYRHRGIALSLIAMAGQRALETRCRALFLHVITYNAAAMALYTRAGFACVARLAAFYHIASGRQPDPATQVYDAYLYVQYVGGPGVASPWDVLSLAVSPLRSALGRINACVPRFCRQQPGAATLEQGFAPGPGRDCSSHGSSSSYPPAPHSFQQPQPPQQPQQPQQQLWLQQEAYQHQQQQPTFTRQRHRKGACPSSSWAASQEDEQQLLCQQPQQQQLVVAQHQQQLLLQQPQQQPAMLRWLFNGASRTQPQLAQLARGPPSPQQPARLLQDRASSQRMGDAANAGAPQQVQLATHSA